MAYLALYRKWRPKTFSEVIGQDAIMKALRNQIRSGHIGHAYLFCGTRGCGKTSTAKIFARAVNCLDPQNGDPCNECELCREGESDFNIVEIDAASNNGVDNIRELRDEVKYPPSRGKYKVYIIDEVHMLSASAFNALLKTLEEPPEHVIFILATTEPHRILPTILSRCQRYDFRRISAADLTRQLQQITQAEGIEAEDAALRYIANAADGASRDALSILDQCASFYLNEPLTLEKVLDVLGASSDSVFSQMTELVYSHNRKDLLLRIEEVFAQGKDTSRFLLDWIAYLRRLLLFEMAGVESDALVGVTAAALEDLKALASHLGPETIFYYIEQLSSLENTLRTVTEKRILMEMGLLRLCRMDDASTDALWTRLEAMQSQLDAMPSQLAAAVSASAPKEPGSNETEPKGTAIEADTAQTAPFPAAKTENRTRSAATSEAPTAAASSAASIPPRFSGRSASGSVLSDAQWQEIVKRVSDQAAAAGRPGLSFMFQFITMKARPDGVDLIAKNSSYKMRIQGANIMDQIVREVAQILGRELPVRLLSEQEYAPVPSAPSASASDDRDLSARLAQLGGLHRLP